MQIRLIVDSACDLDSEYIKRNNIIVIPMKTLFGEESYLEGVELSPDQFYHKLIESDTLPKTSQLNPFDYKEVFDQIAKEGDRAIVMVLSSKLSGSYQNALMVAKDYPDIIFPIDTANVTIGERILTDYALRLIAENRPIEEIVSILNEAKNKICVIALLDTLEYLKKGGRISATASMLGELLSIKPVIAIENGEVAILGKARGSKKGNNMLIEQIELHGGIDYSMPLCLGYSGLSVELLNKYIEDSAFLWEDYLNYLPISRIGSTIGTHVGPGAIAVAFFHK